MPSVRNISRAYPSQKQLLQILNELKTETDRGAALIGAAILDKMLVLSLLGRLAKAPELHDEWFYNEGAVFGTLSDRTKAARALGVVGPKTEADIDIIRTIRNQFAHALVPVSFTDTAIAAQCEKLGAEPHPYWPELSEPRRRFQARCIGLITELSTVGQRDLTARLKKQLHIRRGLP